MTQLALLKRSDTNLVLIACCDQMEQAMALATELSKMQAFSVAVLACLPTLGAFKDEIHQALGACHIQNSWYATSPSEALQVASSFFDAPQCLQAAEAKLEVVVGSLRPNKEILASQADAGTGDVAYEAGASLVAQVSESVALQNHAAAPNATRENTQSFEADTGFESNNNEQRDPSKESEEGQLVAHKQMCVDGDAAEAVPKSNQEENEAHVAPSLQSTQDKGGGLQSSEQPAEEHAGALLMPCAKSDAGTAHSITEALQKRLGKNGAAAILKQYKQAVMRDGEGRNKRFWVNAAGSTVKLANEAANLAAAADRWQPNLELELAYDDLSDSSSLDGHESPRHRQTKEYAQARQVARAAGAQPHP